MRRIADFVKERHFALAIIVWAIALTYALFFCVQYEVHECPEPIVKIIYETVVVEVEDPSRAPYFQEVTKNMTEEEYHLLAALVKAEGGGESSVGQRSIVEVVFHRVLDPDFPDTVKEVITQKNQFSTLHKLGNMNPTQEQYDAIDIVANEIEPVLPKEVVFFASCQMNRALYETIGGHNFYYK